MSDALEAAYAHCETLLRESDRDRWLSALFAPPDKRRHLHALGAYALEIARVRDVVREPMPGEIRLQWWVDALVGPGHGDVAGHPVAAALIDTADRFRLSRAGLAAMADARRTDLYDDPIPSLNDLEGWAGETTSVPLAQAAVVLCDGEDPRAADAAGHAGVAFAMIGILRALPRDARRGQVLLPEDLLARHGTDAAAVRRAEPTAAVKAALAEFREHVRHHRDRALKALPTADARARPAFVGLGLVDPLLTALGRRRDPFALPPAAVPGWRKPIALWRFSRRLARL